jgi:hypothetical protein
MIVGAHEFSGQPAFLCAPAVYNDHGIKSFTVQLQSDNRKVVVEMVNLIP